MNRPGEFSHVTKVQALQRQKSRCACCGTPLYGLGNSGRASHAFGEGAQAHHVEHLKFGGTDSVDNCVILCQSCHYSAHEGGNYRWGDVVGSRNSLGRWSRSAERRDFPHFHG